MLNNLPYYYVSNLLSYHVYNLFVTWFMGFYNLHFRNLVWFLQNFRSLSLSLTSLSGNSATFNICPFKRLKTCTMFPLNMLGTWLLSFSQVYLSIFSLNFFWYLSLALKMRAKFTKQFHSGWISIEESLTVLIFSLCNSAKITCTPKNTFFSLNPHKKVPSFLLI